MESCSKPSSNSSRTALRIKPASWPKRSGVFPASKTPITRGLGHEPARKGLDWSSSLRHGPADIPPVELAGMLAGASAAYHRAKGEQEIELVWTGPSSRLIATRKTEQALLQVIDAAQSRLFITSFVAYDVASIMSALRKAIDRRVEVSMLLESSDKHGGGVSVDAIGQNESGPSHGAIYFLGDKGDSSPAARFTPRSRYATKLCASSPAQTSPGMLWKKTWRPVC